MSHQEKEASYQATNSYSTLNALTNTTKNVWFVCHGLGYLSRYFIRYFEGLNPDENYIIAPQAASKYYMNGEFKHVGASWLTKENTKKETENVLRNLDAVYEAENIPANVNFIVMGYSQGVSVAMRWVARRKIQCDKLIMYAGGVPVELIASDFDHLRGRASVHSVIGDKDQYLTDERMALEKKKMDVLFGDAYEFSIFDGTHEVKPEIIVSLA